MNGRRGFLSGVAKLASVGGAALLLPRDALPEVQRSGHLRDAVEEVYVDESYELSQEEVIKLLARVKELEHAIANPTWFQGRHGADGANGVDGRDGMQGLPGPPGIGGDGLLGASIKDDRWGLYTLQDTSGYQITIPTGVSSVNGIMPDGDGNVFIGCPDPSTAVQLDRLQDCVDYLMGARSAIS